MSLDDHIGLLVRAAIEPMLTALEDRLVEKIESLDRPNAPDAVPDLLTASDLAKRLRMSRRSLQRMVAAGDAPQPIRAMPAAPRWRRVDVDAWLDEGGTT